ncbi:MAG: carboxyltransferase domain-containing protein [Eggerthellaceae bacterium]
MAGFTITIAGDSALNLEFARAISPETSAKIRMAADNLTADPIEGVTELVPTFCSLMVYYNPLAITFDELSAKLRGKLRDVGEVDLSVQDRAHPLCYGAISGPTWKTSPNMPVPPTR